MPMNYLPRYHTTAVQSYYRRRENTSEEARAKPGTLVETINMLYNYSSDPLEKR